GTCIAPSPVFSFRARWANGAPASHNEWALPKSTPGFGFAVTPAMICHSSRAGPASILPRRAPVSITSLGGRARLHERLEQRQVTVGGPAHLRGHERGGELAQ